MHKDELDTIVAWSNVILTALNGALVVATFMAVRESKKASARQIGVQTWLQLQQRFDSVEMLKARKKFAEQLEAYEPSKYDGVSDTVVNFFEDVGTLYKAGYIDKKLADSSFGFYAVRYWEAAKPYIDQQRRRTREDSSIYEDFESLARVARLPKERIDDTDLSRFLLDESKLQTN